jgi:hypothetical protein
MEGYWEKRLLERERERERVRERVIELNKILWECIMVGSLMITPD